MKTVFKVLAKIFKVAVLFLLFVPVLIVFFFSFFTVNVPSSIVEHVCAKVSGKDFLVSAQGATFRLTEGVRLHGLRVMDTHKVTTMPIVSARRVDVFMDLFQLPIDWARVVKFVKIDGLEYPRLPDSYYIKKPHVERDEPLVLDLPYIEPFPVRLQDANILGLNMRAVDIGGIVVTPSCARFEDIRVNWPDADVRMAVTGDAVLDLDAQQIKASLFGQARQHNIRPFLSVLDLDISLEYMDAFTGILTPIDVNGRFDINLRNLDFRMNLGLHPSGGAYRDVPMKDVHGALDVYSYVRGTNLNARVKAGPISASLAAGGDLSGAVVIDITNGVGTVSFESVKSTATLEDDFLIAHNIKRSLLSFLECETPPEMSIEGSIAIDPANFNLNNLSGRGAFARGKVFGIPVLDASAAWGLTGDIVSVASARANAMHGGNIAGGAMFRFPGLNSSNGAFRAEMQLGNVSVMDLVEALGFDPGDKHGLVDANLSFTGMLGDDFKSNLDGRGSIKCRNGHLAQLRLFSGFTKYLAENVPGIANVVNQSQGSCTFTVDDGVFETHDLFIEGDVFSIKGSGTYDLVNDNVDFLVQVNLFRNDSFLSRLATPISWTFNKLLLEFKITGPVAEPVWTNTSMLGGLGGGKGK